MHRCLYSTWHRSLWLYQRQGPSQCARRYCWILSYFKQGTFYTREFSFIFSFLGLCLLVDSATFRAASRGTILTPSDRKYTVPLFLARCVILVPQFLTACYVFAKLLNENDEYSQCRESGSGMGKRSYAIIEFEILMNFQLLTTEKGLLIWNAIFNLCIGLSGATCLFFTFDNFGREPIKRRKLSNSLDDLYYTKINTDAWETRLSRISFLCGGNRR